MESSKEKKSQLPSRKIKILQTIQKNIVTIGIGTNSATKLKSFNARILWGLLILGIAIISNMMYIIDDVETFAEYTQSIYKCSAYILEALDLLIAIYISSETNIMIDNCERLVNTS